MRFEPIAGSDLRLIHLTPHGDARGSFARVWCARTFEEAGVHFVPVQANSSITRGVGALRGMHLQREPKPDAKLVRCARGRVHDVTVDLRAGSPGCGRAYAVELSGDEPAALFVPAGFAHGFQALSDEVVIEYMMGEYYEPEFYGGFRYDDPAVSIRWPLPVTSLSDRDRDWPALHPDLQRGNGF